MYTMLAGQMATAERVHCVGCARSDQTSTHSYANVTQTPTGRRVALGSGLLRCAGCGGTMYLNRIAEGERSALYLCGRHLKGSPCTARGYTAALAHTAALAELRRLRRAPWTAEGEQHLLGTDSQRSAALAAIEQALNHERTALRTYVRGIALLAQDPTPEERVEFAAVRAEFTARVWTASWRTTTRRVCATSWSARSRRQLSWSAGRRATPSGRGRRCPGSLTSRSSWMPACSSWRRPSRRPCCPPAPSCTGPAYAATGGASGRSLA